MMLDMTIRSSSKGAKSLDDVMRYLYNEYFKKGRNYTPEDYQKAAEMMAGKSLDDFFAKYVRGKADIDYNPIVKPFGLEVSSANAEPRPIVHRSDRGEDNGTFDRAFGSCRHACVRSGPEQRRPDRRNRRQSGEPDVPSSYLNDRRPNDTVRLTIFRFDTMRDINIKLGVDTRTDLSFAAIASPSADQRRLYKDYLLADIGGAGDE